MNAENQTFMVTSKGPDGSSMACFIEAWCMHIDDQGRLLFTDKITGLIAAYQDKEWLSVTPSAGKSIQTLMAV